MGAAQAVVLAVVAEKHEVAGAKPAWATPVGTHMRAHLDLQPVLQERRKVSCTVVWGEQFCAGRMEMGM